MSSWQDPLWGVFQEYVQKRNECMIEEQRSLTVEQGRLKAAFSCTLPDLSCHAEKTQFEWSDPNWNAPLKPPGLFELLGSNCTSTQCALPASPLKPPGIFEQNTTGCLKRVNSSRSLASTAATASGDDEDSKVTATAAEEASAVKEVIRELHIERLSNGHLKASWPVPAKKLRGKDQQIVSPSFEITPGSSFKLMLKPKPMGDKKGQASFSKARGVGSVDLKFMAGSTLAPTLRFRVGVGEVYPCGYIDHDFNDSATVGSLATKTFDFASAVESNSSTFLVSLEVLF